MGKFSIYSRLYLSQDGNVFVTRWNCICHRSSPRVHRLAWQGLDWSRAERTSGLRVLGTQAQAAEFLPASTGTQPVTHLLFQQMYLSKKRWICRSLQKIFVIYSESLECKSRPKLLHASSAPPAGALLALTKRIVMATIQYDFSFFDKIENVSAFFIFLWDVLNLWSSQGKHFQPIF